MSEPQKTSLQRILGALRSAPILTVLMVVGFYSGNWLIENLYKIAYPWFYVIFPVVIFALARLVLLRARTHARDFMYLLRLR